VFLVLSCVLCGKNAELEKIVELQDIVELFICLFVELKNI
jgi:hypothetical protein